MSGPSKRQLIVSLTVATLLILACLGLLIRLSPQNVPSNSRPGTGQLHPGDFQ